MTQGPSMVDRLDGVNEGLGKKAPVRCATTENITLSGIGLGNIIDGITLAATDANLRVLVKNQTDATENGVYNAATSTWTRALDFDGNRDFRRGTMVFVTQGDTNAATMWYVSSADVMTVDEDNINFTQWTGAGGFPNASYIVAEDEDAELPQSRLATQGAGMTLTDAGAAGNYTFAVSANTRTVEIFMIIDGGGSAIVSGIKGDIVVPFNCTIVEAHALVDQTGSIVVDVWKDTYANFPPTDADSITASAPITISSATKAKDTTLTGWTTSVTAGDILRFNVDSATTVTRCTVGLVARKP